MNAMARSALSAYAEVGLETRVSQASPHQLIQLLYEGALAAIAMAKGHMLRNEVAAKGAAISRAIAIIDDGLILSLDVGAGGEIAQNLKDLYEYMSYRLLMANVNNDPEALDEVARLLGDLKGAWDQIGNASGAAPQDAPRGEMEKSSKSYGEA